MKSHYDFLIVGAGLYGAAFAWEARRRGKRGKQMMEEHITLRTATPEDAAALLDIYGCYVESTAVSFEYEVPGEAEFRSRIE